ncbi:DsbA family protein [Methylovirgula sp. HY1]|uniref:DsbA family protein n=1 Tax=Methylovirgula sp. HY1 TaxID=2822761 RepID=UPI001C5B9238|nr:DsbA family protein [Methylovirgula sp. HY1]QXX73387.1 Disulfide bond formation protein D [Methylovirgula sp. HY1]
MQAFKNGPFSSKSRRQILAILAVTSLGLVGAVGIAASTIAPAHAQGATFPVDELMAKEALPDIVQGKADAPITIIEYASMTCSHCAAFHVETYPVLVKKYIDTGKVRFILREFPLDPLAAAGFMLARCAGPDKRDAMIDLLFNKQRYWAFTDKPLEALADLVKQTGMDQKSFDTCVNDQALYNKINEVRDRAAQKFGVNATPTFFINGKKVAGEMNPQIMEKELQPLLKKS